MVRRWSSWYVARFIKSLIRASKVFRSRLNSCICRHIASFWNRYGYEGCQHTLNISLRQEPKNSAKEGRSDAKKPTSRSSFHGMSASMWPFKLPLTVVACFLRGGVDSSWSWGAGLFLSSIFTRRDEEREIGRSLTRVISATDPRVTTDSAVRVLEAHVEEKERERERKRERERELAREGGRERVCVEVMG